jgi:hypothetical protein
MVEDVDDGQRFRVKKTKGGDRLVPIFSGPADWKSANGFHAMRLILSCLGTEGEYALWDSEKNKEMDEEEWKRMKHKAVSKPPIRHTPTGFVSTKTCINSLAQGQGLGGPSPKDRYREFVSKLGSDYVLELSEDEWKDQCTGSTFVPPVRHKVCNTLNITTSFAVYMGGAKGSCFCAGKHAGYRPSSGYYEAMTSVDVCNRLGWFQAFHGQGAKLTFPSRADFDAIVTSYPPGEQTSHVIKIPATCGVCRVTKRASIHQFQSNAGISCICDKMSYSDPQYYDLMHDSRVCTALSMFAALHRGLGRIVMPSREAFYDAISRQKGVPSSFAVIPGVTCTTCGYASDGQQIAHPHLAKLRTNQGIACFCSGRMSPSCPIYYDCMCNAELCAKLDRFAAFHRHKVRVALPDRLTFIDAVKRHGAHAHLPGLRCTVCNVCSDGTNVNSLQQNQGISCFCRGRLVLSDPQYYDCMCDAALCNRLNVFGAFHRHESRLSLPTREEFIQTIQDMPTTTSANLAKLAFWCNLCGQCTMSTTIGHLRVGGGCIHCRHKTELKLLQWLGTRFLSATVSPQHRGPKSKCGGQTHFDFLLTFPDGFRVLVELDGAQHFWVLYHYTDDGCERDLLKEAWALQQGLCVIRVLQEDVWNDRLDWQGWILRSIEAARECGDARVFTPDAPEYQANESAYVKLHESGIVPTQ